MDLASLLLVKVFSSQSLCFVGSNVWINSKFANVVHPPIWSNLLDFVVRFGLGLGFVLSSSSSYVRVRFGLDYGWVCVRLGLWLGLC